MDEAYSQDVLKVFVHYYEKGWLYRGLRTVNWCPKDGTSLRAGTGIRGYRNQTLVYKIFAGDNGRDHSPRNDAGRYRDCRESRRQEIQHLIGKTAVLPIQNREIPIVGDIAIDPKFGTGAVKVTPAHDILDFEIGQRHKLETIQVIDERAKMTVIAGKYAGLKAVEAREKNRERPQRNGASGKRRKYQTRAAKCYRC